MGEEGRAHHAGREYGVFAYAPGLDLGEILEDGPLGEGATEALARGCRAALAATSVSHGALRLSQIRVGPDGRVRIVGFTGRGADDEHTLTELLEECRGGGDSRSLAERVSGRESTVHAHALTGLTIGEASGGKENPKAKTAAFAAVTLILGLLTGLFLASGGA